MLNKGTVRRYLSRTGPRVMCWQIFFSFDFSELRVLFIYLYIFLLISNRVKRFDDNKHNISVHALLHQIEQS